MPSKHHLIGPSGYAEWSNCPGSLIGPPPERSGNDAADEGTACHALLELVLQFGIDPQQMLGKVVDPALPKWKVTTEMIQAVQLFVDILKYQCTNLGIPLSAVQSEKYIVHDGIPEELFGGTTDCIAVGDGVILVMDLKYGSGPVKATSGQLTCYALLAMAALATQTPARPINRVVQVIIQPRSSDGEVYTVHEPSQEEIINTWQKIQRTAQIYLAHRHLPVSPTEFLQTGKHCKWCPRMTSCPAQLKDLSDAYQAAQIPEALSTQQELERLAYWLEREEMISSFFKKVKVRLLNLAQAGVSIPEYKLVAKFTNRKWVDLPPEQIVQALSQFQLTPQELYEMKLASAPQVEKKLLARIVDAKTRRDAKAYFNNHFTRRLPAGVTLKKRSERGEEIKGGTLQQFLDAVASGEGEESDE